ncbi:Bifunctional purine biosynthetic protein ADE5,7 [Coniosporium apollinis]|uniref:phosphoribosylglycinamide formyltransferase 1 n=1 Tax=Coniosporium apollinis TaxID=61459 RepID=A0ABQ9P295_9PEZI|nr:Bifunctional purine biosynthetic protein ADE5,7 [Coniosporium apollinis]
MAEGRPTKIAVLISGNGSNLQALIDASNTPALPNTRIVSVISNRKDAYGLQRAAKASIPTERLSLLKYKKTLYPNNEETARQKYDEKLANVVLGIEGGDKAEEDKSGKKLEKPDVIVCAGFMHILTENFLTPIEEAGIPIINLHPALPGAYDGANAIERAHKDFQDGKADKTGVMIHYVIKDVDRGEPIVIKEIPFEPEDTDLDHLTERLHSVEHKAIVEGTRKAIQSLQESTAMVKGARSAIQSLKERQLRKGVSWYVLSRPTLVPFNLRMLIFHI